MREPVLNFGLKLNTKTLKENGVASYESVKKPSILNYPRSFLGSEGSITKALLTYFTNAGILLNLTDMGLFSLS
jgi:hypothetical protein